MHYYELNCRNCMQTYNANIVKLLPYIVVDIIYQSDKIFICTFMYIICRSIITCLFICLYTNAPGLMHLIYNPDSIF